MSQTRLCYCSRIWKSLNIPAEIKRQAIEAASDWSAALAAVPIRQMDDSTALIMEKTAAEKGFAGDNLSDDARHELFRQLSSKLKLDPVLIALYVEGLSIKRR